MNTLSWFIYLSDVLPAIGNFFAPFGSLGAIISFATFVLLTLPVDWINVFKPTYGKTNLTEEQVSESIKSLRGLARRCMVLFCLMWVAGAAIPNKNTFYMIAASEAAEVVITNDNVQEVFNELTSLIKSELQSMNGNIPKIKAPE